MNKVTLLTTTEAALAAGVRPGTIRQWHRRGHLPRRYGTPRKPRWSLDDITAAATRHTRREWTERLDTRNVPNVTTGSVPGA